MSKIQCLGVLVRQIVSAAADEILEAVEKMIAEEMSQSKREISRQRKMLDACLQPEIGLNMAEELDLTEDFLSEHFLRELQKLGSSPRQKTPECLQTERSNKEPLRNSQEEEEEEDRRPLPFTSAEQIQSIEADEDSNMSQIQDPLVLVRQSVAADGIVEAVEMISGHEGEINQSKRDIGIPDEMNRVEEPLPGPSAEQMIIEADEEVPPPGLSEAEKEVGDNRNATQDAHDDSSVESHNKTACGVCGKVFPQTPQRRRLKVHMRSHVGEFRCEVCGESFSFRRNLTKHLGTHSGEEPSGCNPTPPDGGGIETQVHNPATISARTRSHTGEKRFRCDVCDKAFRQRSTLADHLRIHSGDRPYLCTTCNKYFRTRSNLKQHMEALYHIKDDDTYRN